MRRKRKLKVRKQRQKQNQRQWKRLFLNHTHFGIVTKTGSNGLDNAVVGSVVAVLPYLLVPHWILFALFLGLNVADWFTGWMKSRIAHKESSSAGWKGVLKKLGYWLMIVLAFGASEHGFC